MVVMMVLVLAILFICGQFPLVCKNVRFFLLLFVFMTLFFMLIFAILVFLIIPVLVLSIRFFIRIVLGLITVSLLLRIIDFMRIRERITGMFFMLVVLVELMHLIMIDFIAIVLSFVIVVLVVDLPVLVEAGRLRDERLDALVGRGRVLVQEKEGVVS